MVLKRVNLRMAILFVFVALAGIGLCAQEVVEWKVSSPLILIPCGRGVEKQMLDQIRAATSNIQSFVSISKAHSGSHVTNDFAAVIQSISDVDVTQFRDSTNRLDVVDLIAFYEAVVNAAHVISEEDVEESVKILEFAFDSAIRIAEYDPAKRRSGFGAGKNFQAYRRGQSGGRPEMLRSWAEEGVAFRRSVCRQILPKWQQIITQPNIQAALYSLPVERRYVIMREIARISDRINELTSRLNRQEHQPMNSVQKAVNNPPKRSCALLLLNGCERQEMPTEDCGACKQKEVCERDIRQTLKSLPNLLDCTQQWDVGLIVTDGQMYFEGNLHNESY